VTIEDQRGDVRVRVVGELDAWTGPVLSGALGGLQHRSGLPVQRQPDVVLDLRRLSFLDTGGVTALADGRLALLTAGRHLRLVGAQPHIRRLLAYAASAGWLDQDLLDPPQAD
jgi:anti-anti-sigma factor